MAYVFKVEDMTCGGCATSVKNAVERLPGVEAAEPELGSRCLIVKHESGVACETIVEAINAAGYTQVSVLAN